MHNNEQDSYVQNTSNIYTKEKVMEKQEICAQAAKTNPKQLATYEEASFQLIPLKKDQQGKMPLESGWSKKEGWSIDKITDHMKKGFNVGVLLDDEHVVVDVDPRNDPDGTSLERFLSDVGLSEDDYIPTVETGGGGKHLYFKKPATVPIRGALKEYPGVEFKSKGQQVVSAGSLHPDTRKVYVWDWLNDDLGKAPMLPRKALVMIRKDKAISSQVSTSGLFTPEDIEKILGCFDPENFREYNRWFKLMAACHHASGGAAIDKFVYWSTSDPEYADHDEAIIIKWNSLSSSSENDRITYWTLRYFLKQDAPEKEYVFQEILVAKDFDDLPAEKERLELFAVEGQIDKLVEEMNVSMAAVMLGKDLYIMVKDVNPHSGEAETRFLSKKGFCDLYMNLLVPIPYKDKVKKVSCANIWLANSNRRTYLGVFMHPKLPKEVYRKVNLWEGWRMEPKKSDWSLMHELIQDVLCDGDTELSTYILKWIALLLQKPEIRPGVALVFRGEEGVGKGTLGRVLLRITGQHGLTISSQKHFTGNFNSHLLGKLFLFADEAMWPGNKKEIGNLKAIITEDDYMYEQKGVDAFSDKNFMHVIMASNEERVIPAGPSSRRFCVIDVSNKRKGDHDFFARLNKQLEEGGMQAMMYDLLQMDITGWHPSHNLPQTRGLAEQKRQSLPPVQDWLAQMLEDDVFPLLEGRLAQWEKGSIQIYANEKDLFLKAFKTFIEERGLQYEKVSLTTIYRAAKVSLGFGRDTDGKKGRYWKAPSIKKMRENFCNYIKDPTHFD